VCCIGEGKTGRDQESLDGMWRGKRSNVSCRGGLKGTAVRCHLVSLLARIPGCGRATIRCLMVWTPTHRRADLSLVYDHPLLRISSRQSLLTHYILLHLLSTLYLPAITPQSLVYHIGTLASLLRDQAIGSRWDSQEKADVEAGKVDDVEWSIRKGRRGQMAKDNEQSRWWRLWEVSAECMDIGGMECYGKSSAELRWHAC
jgi:hypothetical protein